jgi:predicted amidophosphoribosyltransferase
MFLNNSDIRCAHLEAHVPLHKRPDTYPKGRVCCRCNYTVLSIYNGDDACWCCTQQFRREAARAAQRRFDIEGRIERMPQRERVGSCSSVTT